MGRVNFANLMSFYAVDCGQLHVQMLRSTAGWLMQMCVRCNSDIKLTAWQLEVFNQLCRCHRFRPGCADAAHTTDVRKNKKITQKCCCKCADLICLPIRCLKVRVQLLECKHVWKTPQNVPCQGFNCLYVTPTDLCVCGCVFVYLCQLLLLYIHHHDS